MTEAKPRSSRHIKLTSHPHDSRETVQVNWGAATPSERGPIIGTITDPDRRNAIGAHSGSYSLYRALAVAAGSLDPVHVPDLTDTAPTAPIGPHAQWGDATKIVSLDPYGHLVSEVFFEELAGGLDIRRPLRSPKPGSTCRKSGLRWPKDACTRTATFLRRTVMCELRRSAIEPVWYLPGIADRLEVSETELRRCLFEHSGGMFTELVTRNDLKLFLPPIGCLTIYCVGDLEAIGDPERKVACRVHDECNGSDVFGSDICTCRPYLAHGIEVCIETAQQNGVGIIVYNRKEGRALGDVTKFLVYNAASVKPAATGPRPILRAPNVWPEYSSCAFRS